MNYERGDVLTLSNNKNYVVVTTVTYEEKNYVYLIAEEDYSDVMFCECDGESFEKVYNAELIKKLLDLCKKDFEEILREYRPEK